MARIAHPLRHLLLPALLTLAGCSGPEASRPVETVRVEVADVAGDAVTDVREAVAPAAEATQGAVAGAAIPLAIGLQDAVQAALHGAVEPAPVRRVAPGAVAHIVRWEVTSPSVYRKRYQGVVCPGGASGPTRGVGWDDGHQTRARITEAWSMHPQLDRILPASGQIGEVRCRAYRAVNRDIITPYPMAYDVFALHSLPAYDELAERTFRDGWDTLKPEARGILTATVYNRGASMRGKRRTEMVALRDVCVPRNDYRCMADQLLSMCRLWVGTPNETGLCNRYRDAARIVLN